MEPHCGWISGFLPSVIDSNTEVSQHCLNRTPLGDSWCCSHVFGYQVCLIMLCSSWLCCTKFGKALVWRLCCQQEWGSKKLPNKSATIKIYGGAVWPIGSCIHSSHPAAPGSIFRVDRGFIMSIEHIYWLVATTKKYRVTKLLLNPKTYANNVGTKFLSGAFSTSDSKFGRKQFFLLILKERLGFRKLLGLEKIGLKPEKKFFRGSRQDRKTFQVFVISFFFVLLWFVCWSFFAGFDLEMRPHWVEDKLQQNVNFRATKEASVCNSFRL